MHQHTHTPHNTARKCTRLGSLCVCVWLFCTFIYLYLEVGLLRDTWVYWLFFFVFFTVFVTLKETGFLCPPFSSYTTLLNYLFAWTWLCSPQHTGEKSHHPDERTSPHMPQSVVSVLSIATFTVDKWLVMFIYFYTKYEWSERPSTATCRRSNCHYIFPPMEALFHSDNLLIRPWTSPRTSRTVRYEWRLRGCVFSEKGECKRHWARAMNRLGRQGGEMRGNEWKKDGEQEIREWRRWRSIEGRRRPSGGGQGFCGW